jgi:mono/diheme cytochrome c family protein
MMPNGRMRMGIIASVACAALALTACGQSGTDKIARGKYLVGIIACDGCHTPGALMGTPDTHRFLAGSEVGFFIPDAGYFYAPNLTSDEASGLGKWSEDDIVTALRTGKRPDGRVLSPIMPWQSFATLTDEDAHAIAAYLKSLAPISNKAPGPFGAKETPTAPYQTVIVPQAAPAASPSTAEPAPAPETAPSPPPAQPTPHQ